MYTPRLSCLVALLPALALGATFTVNNLGDAVDAAPGDGVCATAAGVCTLRAAVQEANHTADADTIILPAGTFLLTRGGTGENAAVTGDLDVTQPLTIQGAGMDATIIDGLSADRIFDVIAPTNSFALSQMTLQNGDADGQFGGAISASGPAPTITVQQVRFTNTRSTAGGGVYQANGSLTLNGCTFTNSVVLAGAGGAVYKTGAGILTVSACTFTSCSSGLGGAIAFSGPDVAAIDGSTFIDCRSAGLGGAVHLAAGGGATFNGCRFESNSSIGDGGAGYYSGSGSVNVIACQFADNSSGDRGGGLLVASGGSLAVSNCSFVNGLSVNIGGGLVFTGGGPLTVAGTEFNGNTSLNQDGGGVYASLSGSSTWENVVAIGNRAGMSGGGIVVASGGGAGFTSCRFNDNQAGNGNGGGLVKTGGGLTAVSLCSFLRNTVGNSGRGGGLYNSTGGGLTVARSTFADNQASGPDANGGGIYVAGGVPGSITDATFWGNRAGHAGGAAWIGVATTLTHCTFSANAAVNMGGSAIFANNVAVTLSNTVVGGSLAGDNCEHAGPGSFVSAGGNITSDATCLPAPGEGDMADTDPRLGALRNNGGPVQTIELLGDSPAIDLAIAASCTVTDARGITRPLDGNGDGGAECDSGAFEFFDCNNNDVDDIAELANGLTSDCNANGVPDGCESPDSDADGIADMCDACTDLDGDGFGDPGFAANTCPLDGCPADAAKSAPGVCGCGAAESDVDADGVCGTVDNCPTVANPDQADSDGDGIGDACETTAPAPAGCAAGLPLALAATAFGLLGIACLPSRGRSHRNS